MPKDLRVLQPRHQRQDQDDGIASHKEYHWIAKSKRFFPVVLKERHYLRIELLIDRWLL